MVNLEKKEVEQERIERLLPVKREMNVGNSYIYQVHLGLFP